MSEHTKGKLEVIPGDSLLSIKFEDGPRLGQIGFAPYWEKFSAEDAANARRLAAAWNALSGLSTDEIEAGLIGDVRAVLAELINDVTAYRCEPCPDIAAKIGTGRGDDLEHVNQGCAVLSRMARKEG